MTSLTGSLMIALMAANGALSAEAAWRAAHVDEDFQIGRWGEDDEANIRRAARWRDFAAAATVMAGL
jgi:chaperone required for assembly of F1-ATPase